MPDPREALLAIHRYLYPENYDPDVPVYEWNAGTIEDVAGMIREALANDPDVRLDPAGDVS